MGKYDEFINQLHAQTGLDIRVITAWVGRENGVNNNVLGITSASAKTSSNPAGLVKFQSQTAAANATATLLKVSPNYAGIRATFSGTPQQQALAIAQSPWRLGGSGLHSVGGTDPYYYAGFVQAGILSGNATAGYWNNRSTGSTTPPSSGGGIDLNPVDAVNNAVNAAAKNVGDAFATPVYFLGIVFIGIALLIVGGLIILKPGEKAAQAGPLIAAAA